MRKLFLLAVLVASLFAASAAAPSKANEVCSNPTGITSVVTIQNAGACGGGGGYFVWECHYNPWYGYAHMDGLWIDSYGWTGGRTHFDNWYC